MMKKRNLYSLTVIGLLILLIYSCSDDIFDGIDNDSKQTVLTVKEAKEFFEEKMGNRYKVQAKSAHSEGKRGLDPGEFTPNWKKTKTTENESVETVNVDIYVGYVYRSLDKVGEERPTSQVYQKLIVVRAKETGTLSSYIMNVIPSSVRYHQSARNFNNAGMNGDFTGTVIYTRLSDNRPVRVDKYKNGQRYVGSSVFNSRALSENVAEMRSLVGDLEFSRYSVMSSYGIIDGGEWGEVVVTPEPCTWCGSTRCTGSCLWDCPYCGNRYCSGGCRYGDGDNPDPGEDPIPDTGGGGGSTPEPDPEDEGPIRVANGDCAIGTLAEALRRLMGENAPSVDDIKKYIMENKTLYNYRPGVGINSGAIIALLQNYLEIQIFAYDSEVKSALDKGQLVVLTHRAVGDESGLAYHTVLILGYTIEDDGKIRYKNYDSLSGNEFNLPVSDKPENKFTFYIINGPKK